MAYSDLLLPFQEVRGFSECFLASPLQYKMLKEKDSKAEDSPWLERCWVVPTGNIHPCQLMALTCTTEVVMPVNEHPL